MKVSFFLEKPNTDISTVFARITWNGNTLKFYPGEAVPPAYWDKSTKRAKQTKHFPTFPEFNARLNKVQQHIENAYRRFKNDNEGREPYPAELRPIVSQILAPNKGVSKEPERVTFLSYFGEFTERSLQGNRIKKGKDARATGYNTNKGFTTTLNHLKAFAIQWRRQMDFDSVDLDFYHDYTSYLTNEKKLSLNTVGDHFKRIKTVLHEATAKGLPTNPAFLSPYFVRTTEETESIYLTEAELASIERLDLSGSKKLDTVRDLFLIGCYTGQRFSDWGNITLQNIESGFIEITQIKTGTPVAIPVHNVVERIFKKYEGNLPRPFSNQKMNDYLKDVAQKVESLKAKDSKSITKAGKKVTTTFEKWQLVTTHTARRTFATLQYLAGVPSITIMAITGHKTERAFLKYIKLTPTDHARIMKLHWQQQATEKMRAV